MIVLHSLLYIFFLNVVTSKQIKVGVILPFYDGLWGFYGEKFLEYNKNRTEQVNISVEVYYSNKSVSIQQAIGAEFIARRFDVLVVASQDSKALKNIVQYATILGVKVVTFIRRIENIKVDAYVAPDNEAVGKLQGKFIVDNYKESSRKGILVLQGPNSDKNSAMFAVPIWKLLGDSNVCQDSFCKSIIVDNWDASNIKKIVADLNSTEREHLGFVAAANDDIGLEFYKQFTTHNDYYMASHDNVKEKVDALCEKMGEEKFMTVDMNQVESVYQTIEVIKVLVENKPVSFTSIDTSYSISQPQILHSVKLIKCSNRTNE